MTRFAIIAATALALVTIAAPITARAQDTYAIFTVKSDGTWNHGGMWDAEGPNKAECKEMAAPIGRDNGAAFTLCIPVQIARTHHLFDRRADNNGDLGAITSGKFRQIDVDWLLRHGAFVAQRAAN